LIGSLPRGRQAPVSRAGGTKLWQANTLALVDYRADHDHSFCLNTAHIVLDRRKPTPQL